MWQPYALAVVLGLVVSAGLYLVVWRPLDEPAEPDRAEARTAHEPRR